MTSGNQLRELARLGAKQRLDGLQAEQAKILALFPELRSSGRASGARATKAAAPRRRSGGMSDEMRKAVGERMRAYWAARRAEKAQSGEGAAAPQAAKRGRKAGRGRRKK